MVLFCGFGNPALAQSKTIMAFGDSLTSGYGLEPAEAYPVLLEKMLREKGYDIRILNAGVSGDTTSSGLTRLEWQLDMQKPDYVILALGGNDMLRAVDPKVTEENLKKMLEILSARKIPVMLSGMRSYRNLGDIFINSFGRIYKKLAKEYDAVLQPFILEDVAFEKDLMQYDNIHPTARGAEVIAQNMLPYVEELLEK